MTDQVAIYLQDAHPIRDGMAYAQACMDCVAAPTGRRGCPGVCFSQN